MCLLVYASLEYRIRKVLREHQTTFPNQKGKLIQHPTARWMFQYIVGTHLLRMPQGEYDINVIHFLPST